jgi:electron transfer flavoprotein beta subunit
VKILVPVKQVARLREGFAAGGASGAAAADVALSQDALEWLPDERDAFSLETALTLNEGLAAGENGETIVVTVGSERAEPALRAGLAMGADRAIRVWDESLAGPLEDIDPLTVARLLAGVAEAEAPDLILCGAQSSDMANAATGIALAGLIDIAHVAIVSEIERDGERLRVQRDLARGAIELLHVDTPALLTVHATTNAPRQPNLRAIKQARSAPLTVLGLDDIGLDAGTVAGSRGSRTTRLLGRPRTAATMIDGSPAEIAAGIAAILSEAVNA